MVLYNFKLLLFLTIVYKSNGNQLVPEEDLLYGDFPSGFLWGVGTSAYQVEGGWNEGGKGLSNWDVWTNTSGTITDGSDGNVAADSYHKFKEDVGLVADMGLNVYRFSLAWARIMPEGTGPVNMEGITYYSELMEELMANGIMPMVTLSHFDMPYRLEKDQGGWLNPQSVDWFATYADICFEHFGHMVPLWTTFNEPEQTVWGGWEVGVWPPGKKENQGRDIYVAAKNILMAHAKVYRLYETKYKSIYEGSVGITLNTQWYEPQDNDNPDHKAQAEKYQQFQLGAWANPAFKGEFPKVFKDAVDTRSQRQGFEKSRLPAFSEEEKIALNGSIDFLGLNLYTAYVVEPKEYPITDVSIESDVGGQQTQDKTWFKSGSPWLSVMPQGMRKTLNWIKDEYDNPPVIITENGYSDNLGNLDDLQRIYYHKHYINNVLKAISLDGCNVKGYVAWSLLDNFEWSFGYTQKFGMVRVDFAHPNRTRTPKESSKYFAKLAKDNGFMASDCPC